MNEVNYILNTMTDRSLIIIDELCRSTSMEEGTAIAMQICDTLAKSKAFTFVTTHFIMLTKLADLFINIKVWQLETVPIGDKRDPKALMLNFKFGLVPGVTSIRGYGIYMARGIWPEQVMKHADELQESFVKKEHNPNFPSIDKRARLRYELNCKLNKLKLRKRFTLAQLNKLVTAYNCEMQKIIGTEDYQYSQNIINQFQDVSNDGLVILDHSIFAGTQSQSNLLASQEDIEIHQVSLNSQERVGIDCASQTKPRMLGLFTPEISSQSCDIDDNNFFNLPLNNEPQIICNYDSQCSSLNVTQIALSQGIRKELQGDNTNFNHDDGLSQLSSSALSQQYAATVRQDEMDKLIDFRVPLPPSRPPPVPESPFINTFSRPLIGDSRKTSTPMIGQDENFFEDNSNLSSISKRYAGDVTHVSTNKLSFSIPRHQEGDIDIASLVEDLESFIEEIENNDENEKGAVIHNDDSSQPSSEIDEHLFQGPPAPLREVPESPFTSTFSRPLQEATRKTSTPTIGRFQPGFRNSSTKRYSGEATHVTTDRKYFSMLRNPEIASKVESLESVVENNDDSEGGAIHNDELSQLSSSPLSQKFEAIMRQDEINKDLFQAPPPPPRRERAPQIPESPFTSIFSRRLQQDNKRTSTPIIGQVIQPDAKCFGNSSNLSTISKRYSGDVTTVTTDRMSLSLPRNYEDDADIASMAEGLDSFVAESKINDGQGSPNLSQPSSGASTQKCGTILREEEMIEPHSQAPPSPFTITFSRPPQDHSKETSTPMIGQIQPKAKSFENPKSKILVGNVTTDRMSLSLPSQRENDMDIASTVEELESFIGTIENMDPKEISTEEAKTHTKIKHWDIFPKVIIKLGPGSISEESIENDSYINDDNTIVNLYGPLSPIQPIFENKLIEPEITKEKRQSEKVEPNTYFDEYAQSPKVIEAFDSTGDNLIAENTGDKQKESEINNENGELIEQDIEENYKVINQQEEKSTAGTHLGVNVNKADEAEKEKSPDLIYNVCTQESISYSPLVTREDHSSTDPDHQINEVLNLQTIEDGDNCSYFNNDDKARKESKTEENPSEKIKNKEAREEHYTNEHFNRIEEVVEIFSGHQDIQKKDSNIEFDLESHITNSLYQSLISVDSGTNNEKFFTPNACGFIAKEPTRPPKKIDIISQIILKPKNTDQKCLNNTRESATNPQKHFSRIEEVNVSLSKDSKPVNVKRKTPKNAFVPAKKVKSSSESSNSKKSTSTLKSGDSKKSISEASKLRNLDGDFSTTSSSSGPKKGQTSTSLSSASRKRDLDNIESSHTLFKKKKNKKFVAPLLKNPSTDNTEAVESASLKKSSVPAYNCPSKLSQKAIRDEFYEQDKKFYESSGSSVELAKVWEERLKRPPRPTPKQIQQTTHVATIVKTHQGVQVIPAEKKMARSSSGNFLKSFITPPSGSVNMNIFSDRNAKTFERFIKSDEKDYKLFNFNFGAPPSQDIEDGKMFNFQQAKSAEYTQTSQSWTFVRKRSDESGNAPISQKSTSSSTLF